MRGWKILNWGFHSSDRGSAWRSWVKARRARFQRHYNKWLINEYLEE